MRWLLILGGAVGVAVMVAGILGLAARARDDSPAATRPAAPRADGEHADRSPAETRPEPTLAEAETACERLAAVAALVGARTRDPVTMLRRLGARVAGIRRGPGALEDLVDGGRDLIPGGGFRPRFDDGTDGQARHFAGVAVAATYASEDTVRRLSIRVRNDPPRSADGLLTERALDFTRLLLAGELATADAGRWIQRRICA